MIYQIGCPDNMSIFGATLQGRQARLGFSSDTFLTSYNLVPKSMKDSAQAMGGARLAYMRGCVKVMAPIASWVTP